MDAAFSSCVFAADTEGKASEGEDLRLRLSCSRKKVSKRGEEEKEGRNALPIRPEMGADLIELKAHSCGTPVWRTHGQESKGREKE
jgi:hypothetical protein